MDQGTEVAAKGVGCGVREVLGVRRGRFRGCAEAVEGQRIGRYVNMDGTIFN